MDLENYVDALFNKIDDPFFVINLSSYEILGLNVPMAVILNNIMKNNRNISSSYTFNVYSRITNINENSTVIVYTATKVIIQRHIVKINKNTISQLFKSKQHDKLVKNTITMLNQFDNIDLLAEGVATQEQADFIRKCGASMATGTLYSQEDFTEIFLR